MTPQELKNSILQLAIQGRLVEQRPEEGTAEELFKQILAEKKRLIKEGKIKKEKPLPEIAEDEKPFEIPESWMWVRTGNIGSWSAGATPSRTSPNFYNGVIPWLKTGDLNDSYIDDIPETISELALEKTSVRLNPEGSVLMAMYGATIGKLGILSIPATTNQACCACIPFSGIENTFLFFFLMASRERFIKMGAGGAQPNISKDKIVNYPLPLPPLAEQKRIVAKIEELLPYIDRYEQAWSKLEDFNKRFPLDMQKSILQTAIQGNLVEQRPEEGTAEELFKQIQAEKKKLIKAKLIGKVKTSTPIPESELPFDLPNNWKWIRLGDILISTDAGKSPQCENRCRNGNEWGVIKTTAVQDGYFLADENKVLPAKFQIQESQIIHQGDFLITRAGPKNRTGIMCVVDDEPTSIILSDKIVRLAYVRGMVEPKYLMRALSSPALQHWVVDAMTGMAASQVNISQDKMWTFVLPLPPLAEQKRIVAKLDELLPLCERLK